jgi:hypothetical protein
MKNSLLILLLLFSLVSFGQVPNNETFSFLDVISEVDLTHPAVQRVDKVTKNSTSGNCSVGCNGHSYQMVWNTNEVITVGYFVTDHSGDFGAITLHDNGNGSMTFTANVAGTDFQAATITDGYGTAENLIPNDPGGTYASDLVNCFAYAITGSFDPRYYPHYIVAGTQLNVENSLLNFRNYGGTPDGIPLPVATAATDIYPTHFLANWENYIGTLEQYYGVTAYYIDVSLNSSFTSFVTGYENLTTQLFPNNMQGVGGYPPQPYPYVLSSGTTYYYRIRAETYNGTTGNSNIISVTTTYMTSSYHDWYLPNYDELLNIFTILTECTFERPYPDCQYKLWIDLNMGDIGGYWSSNDLTGLYAKAASSFLDGNPMTVLKITHLKVRAIRQFTTGAPYYSIGDVGPAGGFISDRVDQGYMDEQFNEVFKYTEVAPSDQSSGANWTDAATICNNL